MAASVLELTRALTVACRSTLRTPFSSLLHKGRKHGSGWGIRHGRGITMKQRVYETHTYTQAAHRRTYESVAFNSTMKSGTPKTRRDGIRTCMRACEISATFVMSTCSPFSDTGSVTTTQLAYAISAQHLAADENKKRKLRLSSSSTRVQ